MGGGGAVVVYDLGGVSISRTVVGVEIGLDVLQIWVGDTYEDMHFEDSRGFN